MYQLPLNCIPLIELSQSFPWRLFSKTKCYPLEKKLTVNVISDEIPDGQCRFTEATLVNLSRYGMLLKSKDTLDKGQSVKVFVETLPGRKVKCMKRMLELTGEILWCASDPETEEKCYGVAFMEMLDLSFDKVTEPALADSTVSKKH